MKGLLILLGLTVVAAGAGAGYLYYADYGVEATITGKGIDSQGHFIVATTEIGGVDYTVHVSKDVYDTACMGWFAIYHVQSGRTLLYDDASRTKLVYDSKTGPRYDPLNPPKCEG